MAEMPPSAQQTRALCTGHAGACADTRRRMQVCPGRTVAACQYLLHSLAQRPHTGRRSTEAHALLVLMSTWPMLASAAAAILCLSGSLNFSTLLTCQLLEALPLAVLSSEAWMSGPARAHATRLCRLASLPDGAEAAWPVGFVLDTECSAQKPLNMPFRTLAHGRFAV